MINVPDLHTIQDKLRKKWVDPCKRCRGTGWEHAAIDDFQSKQVECECRKSMGYELRFRMGGVPPEYWDIDDMKMEYNLHNYDIILDYCQDIRDARRTARAFTLCGENGTGKTAMAIRILSAAARAGYSVGYITAHDYITAIPNTWKNPDLGVWLSELVEADFLVLDELGKEYRAKEASKMAELDSLVRARSTAQKPTLVVTNLTSQEMVDAYGASIDSILSQRNRKLLYEPGDYRKRPARKG